MAFILAITSLVLNTINTKNRNADNDDDVDQCTASKKILIHR